MLDKTIFNQIMKLLGWCKIDVFSSRLNHQVVSKYHEPEEHMNIYEVPLTIKVNPMWHFIPGMLSRSKIVTRFLLNSINNEIK